ncbi:MAG: acyltransferase [Mucilaginibacter sp.]|uniref:acyltransferase family protein n=1 Tax=Mucilaginibacter sp. TaxID=1882438 RepID=UPI0031A571E6
MFENDKTIYSIVYLRAIAALAVCAIHFKLNTGITLNKTFNYIIDNGHQGVTVFFVISGFILPISLYRKGYKISGFFNFIIKRSLRVDPPFWFSILLLFTIGFYPLSLIKVSTILAHITYTVPFFNGQHWFTEVYWTLSIEFQFYLILGLLFPVFMKLPKLITVSLLVLISYFCLRFTVRWFIISYVYQFTFGFIAFLGYTQLIKAKEFWISFIGFTLLICFSKSIISGLVPFFTVLAIILIKSRKIEPIGNFLGTISYSIYLVHIPVMAFVGHIFSGYSLTPIALCGLYVITIIPAAYIMYMIVERPALKLSKRVFLK